MIRLPTLRNISGFPKYFKDASKSLCSRIRSIRQLVKVDEDFPDEGAKEQAEFGE